jgi:hypothetical protein
VPLPITDGIVRSRVLPGFQFRQSDLCAQPDWDGLRADPVYADFVLPGWTAAEQRAETEAAARRQAEAELARLRAEIAASKQ